MLGVYYHGAEFIEGEFFVVFAQAGLFENGGAGGFEFDCYIC